MILYEKKNHIVCLSWQ